MVGWMAVVVVVVLVADDGGEKCNNHSPTPGHTPPFYRCIGWWRTHTQTHTLAHSDDCHLVLVVPCPPASVWVSVSTRTFTQKAQKHQQPQHLISYFPP